MAFAPLIIAGVGMAISAYGQWKAGKAAKKAGEAQQRAADQGAELLDYNAHVADVQATDATERGEEDVSRFRQGVRLMVGEQRAGQAASGIDVGYGSALDVQADASFLGELDALTLRTNAAREAWGYKVQAVDLRVRAKVLREEGVNLAEAGRQAQSQHRIAAAGSIVTGSGSLIAQAYGMRDK